MIKEVMAMVLGGIVACLSGWLCCGILFTVGADLF